MLKVVYLCSSITEKVLVRYDDAELVVRYFKDKIDFKPDIVLILGTHTDATLSKWNYPKLFLDCTMLRECRSFSCYKNGFLKKSEVEAEYKINNVPGNSIYEAAGKEILNKFYRLGKPEPNSAPAVIVCLQIPLDGNLKEIKKDHTRYMYYDFIRDIFKIVPRDYKIIIREHPLIKTWGGKGTRWEKIKAGVFKYRNKLDQLIKKSKRNAVLDKNAKIADTIKNEFIKCAFTINSSSGIHLLANNIPIATDIYSIYGECLGLPKKADFLKRKINFKDFISAGVDTKKLESFVGFYSLNYGIKAGVNTSDFKELLKDPCFFKKVKEISLLR